jgi:non-ribosomal peptide synthetase component F
MFDLTLVVADNEDEIWLDAKYNTDLFDDDRIARMFGHYQTLLEAVATGPDRRLAELPMLTNGERQQLLVEWNATDVILSQDVCVHQLFERQVERTPDAIAVVFGNQKITYRQLNQRSNQLAYHLRKLEIEPDQLVGICGGRCIEMVVGLLGVLKARGTYLPLDPAYPQERLAFMLQDSRAALVVTQGKLRDRLPEDSDILCLDTEWQRITENDSNLDSNVNASNLAYVIYTSGSTEQPKGVEITHRAVANFLNSMRLMPGMEAQDTLLSVTTLSFDIFGLELWLPLSTGAKVVIVPEQVVKRW